MGSSGSYVRTFFFRFFLGFLFLPFFFGIRKSDFPSYVQGLETTSVRVTEPSRNRVTEPIRVQESSDETDLFIGEISPPMLPKTLFLTDVLDVLHTRDELLCRTKGEKGECPPTHWKQVE